MEGESNNVLGAAKLGEISLYHPFWNWVVLACGAVAVMLFIEYLWDRRKK